jgi:cobalt-zinc-cadmium efflux system membrane fusion protein
MKMQIRAVLKYMAMGVALVGLVAGGAFFAPKLIRHLSPETSEATADDDATAPVVDRVSGKDAIRLPKEVAARLGVETEVVESSTAPVLLELSGTLMLDSDRLAHVRARFTGEIVEWGDGEGKAPLSLGQRVRKGQLLAVIWSRDLGEKKSELVDGLSQFRVDQDSLTRINKVAGDGAVPDRVIRDAQRKVEADRIAVARAERTLQSWRVSQEEIDAVRAEADRLARGAKPKREELPRQWARVEVRAPWDGVIIEKNVALGDLVDTSTDLFKIADLSRLRVMAHAYEEDLPSLDGLKDSRRQWSVVVGSGSEDSVTREGRFEQIGAIIDPNQHTALVMGSVANTDGRLRVGQFVTVRVEIAPPKMEVAIPASALAEEGGHTSVLVQPDGNSRYVRRQVAVSRRCGGKVFLRGNISAEEKARGVETLLPGERVVTSRLVQLTASISNGQDTSAVPR